MSRRYGKCLLEHNEMTAQMVREMPPWNMRRCMSRWYGKYLVEQEEMPEQMVWEMPPGTRGNA
jgi:hypothetical protein